MEYPDDSYRRPSPPIRRKSALPLILGLIVGGLVLIVLVCAGIAFWFFRGLSEEVPIAQASAEALLKDLRANRIEAAYAQTSLAFKAKTTEDQFRAFLKAFPALTTHQSATLTLQGMHSGTNGTNAVFVATLLGPNGASTCRVTLIKLGEDWMVQGLNVP
jgi:predicted PurR-regulated permease PerM